VWLALLALGDAAATDAPAHWVDLYDALLVASADGDLEASALALRDLLRSDLEVTDAATDETVFRLGETLYALGRVDEAREALLDGRRSGTCNAACRELFETIEIEQESVTRLPTRWTFEDSDHGFFHQWAFQDTGALRLGDPGTGDAVLIWETTVQSRQPDRLVVGFSAMDPGPGVVALTVTSRTMEALLQVVVEDMAGRQFGSPGIPLAVGAPVRLRFRLDELASVDGNPGVLDPSQISRLYLVDRTGRTRATGRNVLWIDDFVVQAP
jgi:hypothetical protein